MDGIDFSSIPEGENIKWVDLVRAINATTNDKKIYLSASPQCVIPDYYLGEAIETGLFDYIWVEYFYYNPCEYLEGNSANLLESWNKWTSNIVLPNNTVFLGIPASSDATGSGYIEPEVLTSEILPELKKASNYGGIMLYNR
ncbi:acidic endochitinase-like [Senna tora]|uniref:Acidic endochitinase-like n=1 Tax=Senna tora TaxID=362788 RepID=A0A834WBH2_9FABA|nr:acidic endochitinase-like [Senna tora]